jgi:hypothetical protein
MLYAAPGTPGAKIQFKPVYDNFINGRFVPALKGQRHAVWPGRHQLPPPDLEHGDRADADGIRRVNRTPAVARQAVASCRDKPG